MLRIHFTADDLRRIRVAPGPDAMWETVLGMQQLMERGPVPSMFAAWRRRARVELAERQLVGAGKLLTTLAPVGVSYFPDFLTPAETVDGLRAGLDALRGTPGNRLLRELAWVSRDRRPSAWMRGLAAKAPRQMDELASAIRALHGAVVAPNWAGATACVEADRGFRGRMLSDGVDSLLNSLRPLAVWESPVLHVRYPVDRDLYLAGRGLRLIPSFFCWRTPVTLANPGLPPVLVYPIHHDDTSSRGPEKQRFVALAGLLGRTRARVLAACEGGATTGELARSLDISAASISEHVKALRAASLASSRRDGGRVVHTLTLLGAALLHDQAPSSSCS